MIAPANPWKARSTRMKRRPWLWSLLALPLAIGLARLRFDTDVLNLLPPELPVVRALQLQQKYLSPARSLFITVRGTDPERVATSTKAVAARLRAASHLARSVRAQPPWLEQPADSAENLAWLWLQQPTDELAALAGRLDPGRVSAELIAVREHLATSLDPQEIARTSYDPLGFSRLPTAADTPTGFDEGVGIFVNVDGTFRVVEVEPVHPRMSYREATGWLDEVRTEAQAAVASESSESATDIQLAYAGSPAFVSEISSGMERDLKNSVLSTALMIAGMFWLAHRSWRPLGWLLVGLGLTLAITLALGGLIFGTLNVISVGFAAVLMGLAVDYGLVSYQEAVATPGASPAEVRGAVARGIWYSAGTTAGTFLLLGFAGLPGLAQLGQLTALGLLVGAVVMLYFYLPRVCPARGKPSAIHVPGDVPQSLERPRVGWPTWIVLGLVTVTMIFGSWPRLQKTDDPLRPRNSLAYAALDELQIQLGRTNETVRLLFAGMDLTKVGREMAVARRVLSAAQSRGEVRSFELPDAFWPRPEFAATNRVIVQTLVSRSEKLRSELNRAGFATNAAALMNAVLASWDRFSNSSPSDWPTNASARWLSGQFSARTADGGWLAVGTVHPTAKGFKIESVGFPDGVTAGSWERLSELLADHVLKRVAILVTLIAGALVGCLWLAFRRIHEVLLGLAALALSFALLLSLMTWTQSSWNLLSLVALPLLLGSSVDSTIHMQLALRRHRGNRTAVWRTTGKALLLCAGANIAGFGSLAWSSNLGLASLDVICAVGVGCVFVVCVGLLPSWWRAVAPPEAEQPPRANQPSRLYIGSLWQLGLRIARVFPEGVARGLSRPLATAYRWAQPGRFEVVVENLLPVTNGDQAEAEEAAQRNFRQFAAKLVDLWRYEAGVDWGARVRPGQGWEHFESARKSGQGLLLVTPHLGNWEFGAPLLARHGMRPLVLTAPEPGRGFTELRAAARSRMGVDTLIVGDDPFAFVQVIRHLQDGGVAALLLDRPPSATAVEVEFFGRPFQASVAAAELARATNCRIVPVFIVREGDGYCAHTLAPITYDRRKLGNRAARVELTGRILRAFEPAIRQFPDQWFHFVPVWKSTADPRPNG